MRCFAVHPRDSERIRRRELTTTIRLNQEPEISGPESERPALTTECLPTLSCRDFPVSFWTFAAVRAPVAPWYGADGYAAGVTRSFLGKVAQFLNGGTSLPVADLLPYKIRELNTQVDRIRQGSKVSSPVSRSAFWAARCTCPQGCDCRRAGPPGLKRRS